MTAAIAQTQFSNLQLELLQLYAAGVPDEYLREIKDLIAKFLMRKAREEAAKVSNEKNYTAATMRQWAAGNLDAR